MSVESFFLAIKVIIGLIATIITILAMIVTIHDLVLAIKDDFTEWLIKHQESKWREKGEN